MADSSPKFQDLSSDGRAFVAVGQDAVDLLESVTPAEKGQAVPYIRIWRIDPDTGNPFHGTDGRPTAPLSLQTIEPPRFGMAAGQGSDVRFRERPPVSLERLAIKTDSPRGIITYRTLLLSFVVHRPDVIFGDGDPDADQWSSLLLPGAIHGLEYGWTASSGVKNGILNGEGFTDNSVSPAAVVPALKRIRFVVTNYSFDIRPDGQIGILISAFEDGEFGLRQAVLGAPPLKKSSGALEAAVPTDVYAGDGRDLLEQLRQTFHNDIKKAAADGPKGIGKVVSFRDLADNVFAPAIAQAYKDLGYNEPSLYLGIFNERAGTATAAFGGKDMSGKPIGDLSIPLAELERIFSSLVADGHQLTLYNFMIPFLNIFRDPRIWDRKGGKRGAAEGSSNALPDVMIKTVANKSRSGRSDVAVYFVDVRREYTRFGDKDVIRKDDVVTGKVTRQGVRDAMRKKGVPVVSLLRGNSYIRDCRFECIQDEKIKGIFMRRYPRLTRLDVPEVSQRPKVETAVDPRELLYSSAISGDLTMLGNHAFDTFALLWLDFGVDVWDGPFFVAEREDMIERGEFLTRIHLVSEGSDPLGTQGRRKRVVTGG